jgi:hypothetical protein
VHSHTPPPALVSALKIQNGPTWTIRCGESDQVPYSSGIASVIGIAFGGTPAAASSAAAATSRTRTRRFPKLLQKVGRRSCSCWIPLVLVPDVRVLDPFGAVCKQAGRPQHPTRNHPGPRPAPPERSSAGSRFSRLIERSLSDEILSTARPTEVACSYRSESRSASTRGCRS